MDVQKIKGILFRNIRMDGTDWLVDVVIAAGAFGFGLLQLTVSANLFVPDDFMRRILGIAAVSPSAYSILATLLTSLPIIFRRKLPWPTFALSAALWIFFEIHTRSAALSLVGPLIALFTLALYRTRTETFIAAGLLMASIALCPSAYASTTLSSLMLMQNMILVAAVALAGYALHVRQDYLEAAEARAQEAERLRESEERRATQAEATAHAEAQKRVEEERVKIAREVHDITAHSLSAVSIQAAAAERLIDSDPTAAKEAIVAVRATAKNALEEMRVMVGLLRSGSENGAETTPTQGTDQLLKLKNYLTDAGIDCTIDMKDYDTTLVPAFIDVALFGIAREASTNIVRHSHSTKCEIILRTSISNAYLTIKDNGIGLSADFEYGKGHGLRGMKERVNILGGTFEMNNAKQGGLRLDISIPLTQKQG